MSASVETPAFLHRMDHLRRTPARVRFVSFEPLLAALGKLDLDGIHWAIVGGESGPKSRPMNVEWVTEIRDQCLAARVPFFFKQWGGTNKKKVGRVLEGRIWDELPLRSPAASRGAGPGNAGGWSQRSIRGKQATSPACDPANDVSFPSAADLL